MNQIETLLALKSVPAFLELRDSELGVIAEVANQHRYPPGHVTVAAGSPLSRLLIVVQGEIQTPSGIILPKMIGVPSLLFDWPLAVDLYAQPQHRTAELDCSCLSIQKQHFFTLIHECPSFLLTASKSLEPTEVYQQNPMVTG